MRDPRLAPFRGPALAFTAFLAVVAGSAAVLFALKLGTDPRTIREYYLGSEARFAAPRTAAGLLEVAVPHLVAIPVVLFAAAHLVGFARAVGPRVQRLLVALSFGSALAGILAGPAVRFVSPALASVKLVAFLLLEASLLGWAALLAVLFAARPAAARAAAQPGRAGEVVP
jgi:hypothetical protein